MGRTALHLYPSTLQYESRIFKMARTQIEKGLCDKVYIVGLHKEGLAEHELLSPGIELHRIKLTWPRPLRGIKTLVFYLELYHRIFYKYVKVKPSIIQCHSLNTLLLSVLIKALTKCTLIYDAHELETESLGLSGIHKQLSKYLEKWLIHKADHVLTVSPSISAWYKNTYRLNEVPCIRNLPYRLDTTLVDKDYFRKTYSIKDSHPVFIYTGVLHSGRSIYALLDVFARMPDRHIVFMGYGLLEPDIATYAQQYSNIHLHLAVTYGEVARYCAAADVGIVLSEHVCLSYYYGYANKMFEYVQAGCAIIASNFPDMGGFVETTACGWACEPESMAIKNLLKALTPDKIEKAKVASRHIRKDYVWETEQDLYIQAIAGS